MPNVFEGLSKVILVLGIVASISFGAREAVAAKATTPCFDPPTWLGECASQEQCEDACRAIGGEGQCMPDGCCLCTFR